MRTAVQLISVPSTGVFFETETGTDECRFWAKAKVNSIYRASAPDVYFSLPYTTIVWVEA